MFDGLDAHLLEVRASLVHGLRSRLIFAPGATETVLAELSRRQARQVKQKLCGLRRGSMRRGRTN
ncbi:hypothetical protein D2E59_20920 [Mycobacteroides abscessus]|uniref:Uncharacterized protein n=1 Tax=Mycobacteroides abscessus TaxID=36809 RepID=A0ABD7HI31_9MYCO|nr:hypothetical protein DDT46_02685 [Mycobacteroides abscessus]PVA36693.1 hypothetical protein DDJ88_12970 [Mycobacteroides abscessus]PVA44154.1 hypothetical protein DDJ35_21805 [Mycobacteroides abscessus]PVA73728.1 hypothetical protein DDJ37_15080 [Mycobacteroides abscessus]PVB11932.1 hypothetical protein DDJ40_16305 [Mycobacteroides abscessus]